jgi:hypothetical protein
MLEARTALIVLLLAAVPLSAAGQGEKADSLLVYGSDFAFGVREPSGWQGDTDVAAKAHANIVFLRVGESLDDAAAPIFVKIVDKADENTAKDLASDMKGYQSRYPKVQFADLDVPHPSYSVLPKLFFIPAKFYEYVAYLNPGKGQPLIFSVWMSAKRPASPEELTAFRFVVNSLVLLPRKVK